MTEKSVDLLYHEEIRRKIYDKVAGRLGEAFIFSGEKTLCIGTDKRGNEILILNPRAKMRPLTLV